MRIISGEFRRRLIRSPEGKDTRPMTDRVRTSLFDRLEVMGYMEGGYAIDIFAGTGSVGIEALSRGVEHVTFIERDAGARKLLVANLRDLGIENRATVLATNALTPAWLNLLPGKTADLIFCDPPYPMSEADDTRLALSKMIDQTAAVASSAALLVLRTSEHTPCISAGKWPEPTTRNYGSMTMHFYLMQPPVKVKFQPAEAIVDEFGVDIKADDTGNEAEAVDAVDATDTTDAKQSDDTNKA